MTVTPVRRPPSPVPDGPRDPDGRSDGARTAADATGARPVPDAPDAHARLPYWPGLDGLRAVAVVAVLLYHAGVTALPGGLLGVDVFFVLSGFLITSLLLQERARTGRIGLRDFWTRRLRRLLPALLLVLVVVALCAPLVTATSDLPSLRNDAFAALLYVANWRFAASGQDYFERFGDPSPLLHLWSLGVEEQFYLLWPLLVLLVLWRAARPAGRVGALALVLAAGSTAALVVLDAGGTDDSRLYYGTDTRALTLLVGAALACLLAARRGRHRRPAGATRLGRAWFALVGLAGAAALGYAFAYVGGEDPRLYAGGFLAVAIATAAVLASVVLVPRAPLSRLLALPPVVGIGRISYGLYLWHWPIFLALDADRTGLRGPALLSVRFAATLVFALASYQLLEKPIRERRWRRPRMRFTVPVATVLTAAAVVVATLPGVLPDRTPTGADGREDLSQVAADEAAADSGVLGVPARPPQAAVTEPVRVLLLGDSVAVTAGAALRDLAPDWKVSLVNRGLLGCGLGPGDRSRYAPDKGFPGGQRCSEIIDNWREATTRFRPDVVLVLSGRWESYDRYVDGRRQSIGQPAHDALLAANLDRAVGLFAGLDIPVSMVTTPCASPSERADGSLDPANDPARSSRYNELLADAVARSTGDARVVDLNALLCPQGRYSESIGGTKVRSDDGVHLTNASGPLIAPLLLGSVRRQVGLPESPERP